MITNSLAYTLHTVSSFEKIYFSVWFTDDASDLPMYIKTILKWNARCLSKFNIPLVILYTGKKVGDTLNRLDKNLLNIDVSSYMDGELSVSLTGTYTNERTTPDAFEIMCYQRFIVAARIFEKATEAQFTHLDCDFMITTDLLNEVESSSMVSDVRSFGTGCTPCSWFNGVRQLENFCDYFSRHPQKCDMIALQKYVAETNVQFEKISLSNSFHKYLKNNAFLSFSVRAKIGKVCKLHNIDIPENKTNKQFLKQMSEFFEFDEFSILFDQEKVPFVHFQGWSRGVAKYIFKHFPLTL